MGDDLDVIRVSRKDPNRIMDGIQNASDGNEVSGDKTFCAVSGHGTDVRVDGRIPEVETDRGPVDGHDRSRDLDEAPRVFRTRSREIRYARLRRGVSGVKAAPAVVRRESQIRKPLTGECEFSGDADGLSLGRKLF